LCGELKYRLLEKQAPLGDPIEIEVRGYNLSIRKEIAQKIKVEVE